MKNITLLFVILLLTSCTAQKKAERQGIEKAKENLTAYEKVFPNLFDTKTDTILQIQNDTLRFERYEIDTVLTANNDTIRIENDLVRIELIRDTLTQYRTRIEVKERIKVVQDTIYHTIKEQTITVPERIIYKNKVPLWCWIVLFLFFVGFFMRVNDRN